MEKLCVIFGAGEYVPPQRKFGKDDLIVAADGGYNAAKAAGYEPHVVIGDFDSGEMPQNTGAIIIKLNRDKDETDTFAAVRTGLRRGYKTFVIYGGTGGRLDHTVANIATLAYLNAFDARGFLVDRGSVATVITDGKITVGKSRRGTVSVFAYGGVAEGVSEKNLKFPLDDVILEPNSVLGTSNETIADKPAEISVKRGSLLVFLPR